MKASTHKPLNSNGQYQFNIGVQVAEHKLRATTNRDSKQFFIFAYAKKFRLPPAASSNAATTSPASSATTTDSVSELGDDIDDNNVDEEQTDSTDTDTASTATNDSTAATPATSSTTNTKKENPVYRYEVTPSDV